MPPLRPGCMLLERSPHVRIAALVEASIAKLLAAKRWAVPNEPPTAPLIGETLEALVVTGRNHRSRRLLLRDLLQRAEEVEFRHAQCSNRQVWRHCLAQKCGSRSLCLRPALQERALCSDRVNLSIGDRNGAVFAEVNGGNEDITTERLGRVPSRKWMAGVSQTAKIPPRSALPVIIADDAENAPVIVPGNCAGSTSMMSGYSAKALRAGPSRAPG